MKSQQEEAKRVFQQAFIKAVRDEIHKSIQRVMTEGITRSFQALGDAAQSVGDDIRRQTEAMERLLAEARRLHPEGIETK